MNKQIVIFPSGQLSPKDKERLSKAGVVAVEAQDPTKVVILIPGSGIVSSDDLLMSALKCCDDAGKGYILVKELFRRLSLKEPSHEPGM